jgi:hypothetical protein
MGLRPWLVWVLVMWFPGSPLPQMSSGDLMELVLAMLRLGGLRTVEKVRGVTR